MREDVKRIAKLLLALGIGIAVALAAAPAVSPVARWMGAEGPIEQPTVVYLRIRLIGLPGSLIMLAAFGVLRGLQNMRTPLWVAAFVSALNAALDPVLIFGVKALGIPAMGVAGAAWATVIGTIVHVAVYWEIQRRRRAAGRPAPRIQSRSTTADVKELLRIGGPSGFHWLLDLGAWTLFVITVARLDAVQAAANMVGITLIRASFMPGYGISTAAQTLVGQYLGARDVASAIDVVATADEGGARGSDPVIVGIDEGGLAQGRAQAGGDAVGVAEGPHRPVVGQVGEAAVEHGVQYPRFGLGVRWAAKRRANRPRSSRRGMETMAQRAVSGALTEQAVNQADAYYLDEAHPYAANGFDDRCRSGDNITGGKDMGDGSLHCVGIDLQSIPLGQF